MWTPVARELTAEEHATAARLRKKQQEVQSRQQEIIRKWQAEVAKATEGMDRASDACRKKNTEVFASYRDEYTAVGKELRAVMKQLSELVPGPKRKAFVWLYERL